MNNSILVSRNEEKAKPDWGLVISSITVSLMVLMRDVGVYLFSPLIFVAVVSLISVFLPYKSLRSFAFFYIVAGSSIHGISRIPLLLALSLKSKKINLFQILLPAVLLVLELLHFASYSFKVEINEFVVYGLYIYYFFFLLFDDNVSDQDVYCDISYFIIGAAASLFIILFHSIIYFGVADTLLGTYRLGSGFEEDLNGSLATAFNPNYMAYYSITAASLALCLKNTIKKRWFKVLLLVVLLLAGIMSSSRAWTILSILVLFLYFLSSKMTGKIKMAIVILGLAIATLQFTNISQAFFERLESRFHDEDLNTAGGRTEIFAEYNDFLNTHPVRIICGTGAVYYKSVCQIPFSTHNGIQQLIVCYGLVGFAFFLFCFLVFYHRYKKVNNVKIIGYIPFFVCFLFLQSIQFVNPASLMLPLMVTMLPLKIHDKQ